MSVTAGDGDPRHGKYTTYSNHRCRCDLCSAAWLDWYAIWRSRQLPLAPDDRRHGSENGYTNYGCRCDACRRSRRKRVVS